MERAAKERRAKLLGVEFKEEDLVKTLEDRAKEQQEEDAPRPDFKLPEKTVRNEDLKKMLDRLGAAQLREQTEDAILELRKTLNNKTEDL